MCEEIHHLVVATIQRVARGFQDHGCCIILLHTTKLHRGRGSHPGVLILFSNIVICKFLVLVHSSVTFLWLPTISRYDEKYSDYSNYLSCFL